MAVMLAEQRAMGIGPLEFEFMLWEHKYRPITGEVLTIGKPAVALSSQGLADVLAFCGVPQISSDLELDTTNSHLPKNLACVTDRALFRSFSNCKVSAVDISDYEGAEIVLDLCSDVPADLHNRFDFIIDAGSLDNIFDPIRALMSMTRMLKPGGRMYIFAWGNSHPTAYLKFSPDWFTDYFAVNEFEDCQTYVALYPSGTTSPKGWEETFASLAGNHDMGVWRYNAYVHGGGGRGYECSSIDSERPFQNFLIAEKGAKSTADRTAVQKHYRGSNTEPYLTSAERFAKSRRPNFRSPRSETNIENKSLGTFGTMSEVAHWTVSQPLSIVSQPPSMAQKLRHLIFKT
jgi:SAM-dependent methyltransferase